MAYTLEGIKVESLIKGAKYFTPESKAAYKTRYSKRVSEGEGGVFFVTSEEIPTAAGVPERRFAVQSYNPVSGEVTLVSALGQYATDYAAHTAAKALACPPAPANLPEHKPEPVISERASVAEAALAAVAPEHVAAVTEAATDNEGAEVIPFPVAANG